MDITIKKGIHVPIYVQIKNSIKEQILTEELVDGIKLPSERALATQLGIHRNTVIKAYEELISAGLIKSSVAPRGYFVTYIPADIGRKKFSFFHKKYPGALNLMLKEEYLHMDTLFSKLFNGGRNDISSGDFISLAADIISPKLYPRDQINEILEDITHSGKFDWFGFSPAQGTPQLIHSIRNLLSRKNIQVSSKEIQIVSETYEAIQYIVRMYLSPNDAILVEEPICPDIFRVFQLMNIHVITVPMDDHGMDTRYLEGLILKYRPKLIYTIPNFHYPTSTVMSLGRRYHLLELSYRYDIPIIEEDCDSSLRYEGAQVPLIKSLDTMGNVIYINSFIGTICPGIRIAYMVASEKIIENVSMIMENTQMFINPLGQFIASEFIDRGYIYCYIEKLKDFGLKNRNFLCNMLNSIDDIDFKFSVPKGGTSLWCYINEAINHQNLLYNSLKSGVSFVPGSLFFPFKNHDGRFIRLCYGNATHEELKEGVNRLAESIRITKNQQADC
ncbi:MAG: PLP-dependent aminotransferase family protein [Eubacteriales bacterium]|nr:PLP-dependent aminotransferase family protein [Eubacteriales bacterium]